MKILSVVLTNPDGEVVAEVPVFVIAAVIIAVGLIVIAARGS